MSHRITLVTLFVALGSVAFSARAENCTEVLVDNVRPQQGQLMVAVYGSASSFGKTPVRQLRLPAGAARMSFKLCDLPGDEVAVTLFQDLDSDGKMGRNLLGVPTEPWGASGTPGTFGPSWDSTRVALDGKAIVVKLSQ
jgi:uncharacterized protein (DUF2141 family)